MVVQAAQQWLLAGWPWRQEQTRRWWWEWDGAGGPWRYHGELVTIINRSWWWTGALAICCLWCSTGADRTWSCYSGWLVMQNAAWYTTSIWSDRVVLVGLPTGVKLGYGLSVKWVPMQALSTYKTESMGARWCCQILRWGACNARLRLLSYSYNLATFAMIISSKEKKISQWQTKLVSRTKTTSSHCWSHVNPCVSLITMGIWRQQIDGACW